MTTNQLRAVAMIQLFAAIMWTIAGSTGPALGHLVAAALLALASR